MEYFRKKEHKGALETFVPAVLPGTRPLDPETRNIAHESAGGDVSCDAGIFLSICAGCLSNTDVSPR